MGGVPDKTLEEYGQTSVEQAKEIADEEAADEVSADDAAAEAKATVSEEETRGDEVAEREQVI